MSFDDITIRVDNLSKCYKIYDRPQDRLKQSIITRMRTLLGRQPSCYYREFWALKNISLEVSPGETVGIIGRNGSGKSTLLQLICGTLVPNTGLVQTRGRLAALLELGAGFNPEFTGRENVYMNATVLGLSQEEIDTRFSDILTFADIGDFIEQPVKYYSSGMYARLAFAVAISVDPAILVVDEALAVGDEPFQRKCFARIEEIKRRGGSILFVSHSPNAVVNLCDRAVLLYRGEQLYTGKPKIALGWYQKLINASPAEGQKIREEIFKLDAKLGDVSEGIQQNNVVLSKNNKETTDTNFATRSVKEDGEGYDASLVSQSAVIYEVNGAEITDIRLTTLDGRDVNQLVNRKRYKVSYNVEFLQHCEDAKCFFAIKTVNGVMLGGGQFPDKAQCGVKCCANSKICLSFEFECSLLVGTYFINCGVLKNDGSLAHRVFDALVFRVVPVEETSSSGVVDFDVVSNQVSI